MNKQIDFSILRDQWMLNPSSVVAYSRAAMDYLAGGSMMDMFSKLALPSVPDNIALIPVNGVMTKADICGGMGTRSLTNMVNEAAANDQYSSIILYFESVPGGQVDGTKVFADAIKAASAKKPVLSAISGMCCSAGVWASSQSTEIYTTSATDQYGCIGVMAKIEKSDEADAKYQVVTSDLSPDKNAEFKDTQLLKDSFLNPVAQMFQDAVKAGRGDNLKTEGKVLTGATYLAGAAKKNGLIDGTMSFDKIVARANYLSKKTNGMSTKNNTAKAEQFVFQNVLKVINADAIAPTPDGFVLSEEQLSILDAHIATDASTIVENDATIAEQASAIQAAGEAITGLTATNGAQATRITELEATVAEYAPKPAVIKNLQAASDNYVDKSKYRTSVDEEAERMAAKSKIK